MSEEHDEEETREEVEPYEGPTYPIDLHDLLGIGLGCVAAILTNVGQFFGLTANEFYASSRYRRKIKQDGAEAVALEKMYERGTYNG